MELMVKPHYKAGTKVQARSFDFMLEIPYDAPLGLMLPRIARVDHVNVLFSWSRSKKFCHTCGDGSHTKVQCRKPFDFNLASVAPLENPIMARAFPAGLAYSAANTHVI